ILWINLLTHGLTGVAIGAEPAELGSMGHPPRAPNQTVLGGGLWTRVLRMAVVVTAATLAIALWAHGSGREWQTMAFVTLTTLQLGVAAGLRARPGIRFNPSLIVAIVASVALVLRGVYVEPLRDLLATAYLLWSDAV